MNAGVGATVGGNGVNANVGLGIGGRGTTPGGGTPGGGTPGGGTPGGGTPGAKNPGTGGGGIIGGIIGGGNRNGMRAVSGLSNQQIAVYRKRCISILRDPNAWDYDLVQMCKALRQAAAR